MEHVKTETIMTATFAVLFIVSEVLAQVPSIKANSVFQIISAVVRVLARKPPPLIPMILLAITLCVAYVMTGCTTITATRGDFTITRTAFGVNLAVPVITIKGAPDGTFSMSVRGVASDSTDAIQAAVQGAIQGMAATAKP